MEKYSIKKRQNDRTHIKAGKFIKENENMNETLKMLWDTVQEEDQEQNT